MMPKIPTPDDYKPASNEHRWGDDRFVRVHSVGGEMFIPPEVSEANPELMAAIQSAFANMGANPDDFIVGSPTGSYNPDTGEQEFGFFSSIKNVFKKIGSNPIAKTALTIGAGMLPGGEVLAPLVSGGLTKAAGGGWGEAVGSAAGTYFGNKVGQSLFGADAGQIQDVTLNNIFSASPSAVPSPTGFITDGGQLLNLFGSNATRLGELGVTGLGSAVANTALNNIAGSSIGQYLGGAIGSAFDPVKEESYDYNAAPITAANLPSSGNVQLNLGGSENLPSGTAETPYVSGAPSGVRYLTGVTNRDSGQNNYSLATSLGDDFRQQRRTGWGGAIAQL
jgi:hypothetical protein